MEVTIDMDEEYETDVEIDFSRYSKEEKEKIIQAIKNNKKHLFKDIMVIVSGEFSRDIDIEPMYNEGYY